MLDARGKDGVLLALLFTGFWLGCCKIKSKWLLASLLQDQEQEK
jgi:hypothetical protein